MNTLIVGLQWGDEGKGKAIDYLAEDFDVVVRFQGGHNAGHTIYWQGEKVVLHLLPSGIFSPRAVSVIAAGVVVNPLQLVEEIGHARALGIGMENLVLSEAAPLILPFHQQLDIIFEESRYVKIGTTRRGIGPAYEDLSGRRAVFVRDLLDEKRFRRKVTPLNDYYNKLIGAWGGPPLAVDDYFSAYLEAGNALRPFVADTTLKLQRLAGAGRSILFESAQGTLLDISLGTYPFVTSSHPTAGGALVGTGLSHKALQQVIGITKAYTTRVGEGPFPTELSDATGEALRAAGREYGATTGRPRRVGWLDLVALDYAVRINGVDRLFVTKLDVLDSFAEIRVATGYDIDGRPAEGFSADSETLERVRPVFKTFPGWRCDTSATRRLEDLPTAARTYLEFVEKSVQVPIGFISVGTAREQTIRC
jgi:adenylosuccinate synthase